MYNRSYNPRQQQVMANAFRLKSDPTARSAHLRKSKPCTNSLPHDEVTCGFAHSEKDYRPPVCFFEEFCHGHQNGQCSMFHGEVTPDTKKEYLTKNNITFQQSITTPPVRSARPLPNGAFTRFCNGVSETTQCERAQGTCTFAHGIGQLALPDDDPKYPIHTCDCCADYRNGLTRKYDPNHYCKVRLAFAQELGYDVKPWMLRNHLLNISAYAKMTAEQKQMIDDIRAEEELLNDPNLDEVCEELEKMGLAEEPISSDAFVEFMMEQERIHGEDDDYLAEDEEVEDVEVIIHPTDSSSTIVRLSELIV